MASFDTAYELVARAEGGYQVKPNDPGNYNTRGELVGTNWGINAKVYEEYLGYPPSRSDMVAMSPATAKDIYRNTYWRRVGGDYIPDQNIANILFDGHVNQGYNGIRFMQRAVGVTEDGKVGPITLAAIIAQSGPILFDRYKDIRIADYHRLANQRPSMADWLPIWLNRMDDFVYENYGTGFQMPPQSLTAAGAILALFLIFRK